MKIESWFAKLLRKKNVELIMRITHGVIDCYVQSEGQEVPLREYLSANKRPTTKSNEAPSGPSPPTAEVPPPGDNQNLPLPEEIVAEAAQAALPVVDQPPAPRSSREDRQARAAERKLQQKIQGVRARATRMGLQGDLSGLDSSQIIGALRNSGIPLPPNWEGVIAGPSNLWKEYALTNQLPGYAEAIQRREAATNSGVAPVPDTSQEGSSSLSSGTAAAPEVIQNYQQWNSGQPYSVVEHGTTYYPPQGAQYSGSGSRGGSSTSSRPSGRWDGTNPASIYLNE
jgi:hypothetical protein